MPATLESVTREALELSPRQRLALAGFLLETSGELPEEPGAESAWHSEMVERVRAVDQGSVVGVPFEMVLERAEARISR